MSYWAQIALQNAANTSIECVIYFHDYIMIILSIILVLTVHALTLVVTTPIVDKVTIESHELETVWTVLPMLVLLFMAYPSLVMLYFREARENSAQDYVVKVIAHQWYWEYETPTANLSPFYLTPDSSLESFDRSLEVAPKVFYTLERTQALSLPLNKSILLYVTRRDVLHSFTVPSFGVKVDAVPGRLNTLRFNTPFPGTYYGQCREICGANHSFIPVEVLVS